MIERIVIYIKPAGVPDLEPITEGDALQVDAERVRQYFAIVPNRSVRDWDGTSAFTGSWSLVHVPTGMTLFGSLRHPNDAHRCARGLEKAGEQHSFNWTPFTLEALRSQDGWPYIAMYIRDQGLALSKERDPIGHPVDAGQEKS